MSTEASYNWTGDAGAVARYGAVSSPKLLATKSDPAQPADTTPRLSAGNLASRILNIEANPVAVVASQFDGSVAVQQPAGTVVARFTPQIPTPFGGS